MSGSATNFSEFDPAEERWSAWVSRLENHLQLNKKTEANDKKFAILAYMGAATYRKLFDRVSPEKKPNDLSYDDIVKSVKDFEEPKVNQWSARISFRQMKQQSGESLREFETRLRAAAADCTWGDGEVQLSLIEQFIAGLCDKNAKQALLLKCKDKKLLSEVFSCADEFVLAQRATSANQIVDTNVHALRFQQRPRFQSKQKPTRKPFQKPFPSRACYRCGDRNHLAPDCPKIGTKCTACETIGHTENVCRKKLFQKNFLEDFPANFIETASDRAPIILQLQINGKPFDMELDTGCALSVIEYEKFVASCPHPNLQKNDVRLRTATGEVIEPFACTTVEVQYNNRRELLKLYLMKNSSFPSLIGRQWIRALSIQIPITSSCHYNNATDIESRISQLLCKFPNLTKDGIGRIPSTEMKLHFKMQNPTPVYHRFRPVAQALLPLVDKELQDLEKSNVIKRVEVSDWAHPIVVVPRAAGKKVRLCADFKVGLNQFLKLEDHPLKCIRQALDNLGTGRRFSKLDISSAFLHMPVREEDQKFLTVNTHRGLFRFTRMSNGLSSAAAVWQRYIEAILAGIPGVEVVIDDIVVTAPTDEEHFQRLEAVLEKLDSQDIRLNKDKCQFFKEQIQFCGFILKHGEIHKCADKMDAIKSAPIPTSTSQLKGFLGLIQFYAAFAPQLAELANPLYEALKGGGDANFVWTNAMHTAFNNLKRELCSPRVLVAFDPEKPLILATDASSYGISAVLSHRYEDNSERPIAYYSRTLTPTERRYTQLEKEALGIKTGMDKFFYYLFGRRFQLLTDSKPLVSIFSPSKSLPPLSATRMQNYSMFLTAFNYDIIYRNTTRHGNADALSRLPRKSEELSALQDHVEEWLINFISEESPLNLKRIASETPKSQFLRSLADALDSPHSKAANFGGVNISEFTMHNGVVFRGHRVVVPESCQTQVLDELHEGHFGSKKMKELARRHVWWSSIDKDIDLKAQSCLACQANSKHPKRTFHYWEPAAKPFDRIHLDFAGPIDGHYLLLIVDAFSKWLEISIAKTKTTEDTLKTLREVIARFGIPKVIVSDNDPTFKSFKLQNFCKKYRIIHKTSPPFHPPSNGQVERYVQTTKQALKKMKAENRSESLHTLVQKFLFRHRLVENSSTNCTPSELMIGRQIRSKLDLMNETPVIARSGSEARRSNSRFAVGDSVLARNYGSGDKWIPGTVEEVLGSNTCSVKVPNGTWKRHSNQMIRKAIGSGQSRDSEVDTDAAGSGLLWYASDDHDAVVTDESFASDDSFQSIDRSEAGDVIEENQDSGNDTSRQGAEDTTVEGDAIVSSENASVNLVGQGIDSSLEQNSGRRSDDANQANEVRRSERTKKQPDRYGDWC